MKDMTDVEQFGRFPICRARHRVKYYSASCLPWVWEFPSKVRSSLRNMNYSEDSYFSQLLSAVRRGTVRNSCMDIH